MSNETKWTPGPWGKHHNGCYWDVGVKQECSVIQIHPSTCIGVQMEADANLIAAAPELYDALDGLLSELGSTSEIDLFSWGISTNEARAALAKARGEKP